MSYRDPLHAARARIKALELKVVRLREERDAWKVAWERATPGSGINFPRAPAESELAAVDARPILQREPAPFLVAALLLGSLGIALIPSHLLGRLAIGAAVLFVIVGAGIWHATRNR